MMKKNLEKMLIEMFGDPIDSALGVNITQSSDIIRGTKEHDINDLGNICSVCGMMSSEGQCGCHEASEEQSDATFEMCPNCELSPCQCNIQDSGMCSSCGAMQEDITSSVCKCKL